MRETGSFQVYSYCSQRLSLRFIDRHSECRPDRKLHSPEVKGHIGGDQRDSWNMNVFTFELPQQYGRYYDVWHETPDAKPCTIAHLRWVDVTKEHDWQTSLQIKSVRWYPIGLE